MSATSPLSCLSFAYYPFSRYGILLVCVVILSACATTTDHMDRLNSTLSTYEKAIRWRDFDAAYAMHQWDQQDLPSLPAQLKYIRVTHYEVKDLHFDQTAMTARQTAIIRYYNTETSRERTLEHVQQWTYHKGNKRWYQTSKPPVFE